MLRNLFLILLLSHGLIHLMGFAKAFEFASFNQLSASISKTAGVFWLLTALLLLVAALLFFLKNDAWWMLAVGGIVLSQWLMIAYWQDARYGTIANVIILLVLLPAAGNWQFRKQIVADLHGFLPKVVPAAPILTQAMVAGLPPIVQKWMEFSQVIGKPMQQFVSLHQTGQMRLKPNGKWTPLTATQYFTVTNPGFIWMADAGKPWMHMVARDLYQEGKGHMLVKTMGLFTVANAKGPTIDQGSMMRYLAETCWFPSAALSAFVNWEAIDSLHAKATMRFGSVEASGVFNFDANGALKGFDALRYYSQKGGDTLEKWHIENDMSSVRTFDGVVIPTKSVVSWQLKDGDFSWLELEITDLQYNVLPPQ